MTVVSNTSPQAPESVRAFAATPPAWLEVRAVPLAHDPILDALDPGERQAILLAQAEGAELTLLDDLDARQAAGARGLNVTGLLGTLLEGAARGLVDLPEAVQQLRRTSFRASPALLKAVLDRATNA